MSVPHMNKNHLTVTYVAHPGIDSNKVLRRTKIKFFCAVLVKILESSLILKKSGSKFFFSAFDLNVHENPTRTQNLDNRKSWVFL